jgi:hypothetical protein
MSKRTADLIVISSRARSSGAVTGLASVGGGFDVIHRPSRFKPERLPRKMFGPLRPSYNRSPGGPCLIRQTLLAMFLGGYVVATATVTLAQSEHFSLNAEQAQAEAVRFLADLVRIDTQDPPGNESKVAHYLEGVLKSEGIESEILEPVAGRASIVARLKSNGKKRPLLIMGHEDVVPVDRSHWTVDPFAGTSMTT